MILESELFWKFVYSYAVGFCITFVIVYFSARLDKESRYGNDASVLAAFAAMIWPIFWVTAIVLEIKYRVRASEIRTAKRHEGRRREP